MSRWDGHSAHSAHQGTDGPAAGGGGTESPGVLSSAHRPGAQGAQPATKEEPLCARPCHGAGQETEADMTHNRAGELKESRAEATARGSQGHTSSG